MRAVALREVRPRSDEDMEIAGRLIGRDRDRILLREGFKGRVDVVGEPLEQREESDRRDRAARQDDLQPADAIRHRAKHDEERRADHE